MELIKLDIFLHDSLFWCTTLVSLHSIQKRAKIDDLFAKTRRRFVQFTNMVGRVDQKKTFSCARYFDNLTKLTCDWQLRKHTWWLFQCYSNTQSIIMQMFYANKQFQKRKYWQPSILELVKCQFSIHQAESFLISTK